MVNSARIKLPTAQQKELIERAKEKTGLSWSGFARFLNFNPHYLSHELRNGLRTLPAQTFRQLCTIAKEDYDKGVAQVVPSNWGQKKSGAKGGGGKPKNVKILVDKTEDLAEIIGVILGDGHLDKSFEAGQYAVKICGGEDDAEYLESFVAPLFLRVFGKPLKNFKFRKAKAMMFYVNDKNAVFTLEHYGLKSGHKKQNDVCLPSWIFENDCYLKACLRGLFDTDGTVFPKSSNPNVPQLELTSKIGGIQRTFRKGLLQLCFKPSKWSRTGSPKCGLYAKNQVEQFVKEIGFHNPKHTTRFENILSKK